MMDLAVHGADGKNVTLGDVAKRQAISQKYLWQIVNPLKQEGLIRAVSGPGGGYALARDPAMITLRDILAALEGDCSLVACTHEPGACPRSCGCASREVWKQVDEKLTSALESITLGDMADKQKAMAHKAVAEYCI